MLALSENRASATLGTRRRQPAPWQLWLVSALFLLVIAWPNLRAFAPGDPDDFMRLDQVRDWLAGQSWWDVRQHRMDPPAGADMHWSRLVDLPIAACLFLARLFVPEPAASIVAMTMVPLFQLLLAMLLLRAVMRALGAGEGAVLAASALPLAFPLLLDAFMPLRIDHHGWQALAALGATLFALRGGWRNALAAGAVAATGLTVSLESLPFAALLGGVFAIRFVRAGDRSFEGYLAGLALTAPLLFLATRPVAGLALAQCDRMSWPHFIGFAGAAAAAFAGRMAPGQNATIGRAAALVPVTTVAGLAIVLPLGACAVDPFAGMDPVLKAEWLDRVAEGLPVWTQTPSAAAMLVWTIVIMLAGARLALQRPASVAVHSRWTELGLLAFGMAAMSLLVMRAGLLAQLLAVPFAALLVANYWPCARAIRNAVPRVVATLGCVLLATPLMASAVAKPFDGLSAAPTAAPTIAGDCDLSRLASLPNAHVFAPFDMGPEILARTGHTVVAGPYHRNQAAMRRVFDAFAGPEGNARAIVEGDHARYLVACLSGDRLGTFARYRPGNLADELQVGRAPEWLEPVPGFEQGALRVWRVI
ncbi:hypothetical protein GRI89_10035 [Altererythrobacter salegens]|uniref:Glycosyltransferase RgtA/B/C/D-like domain-containing protein n=1 Tax=Croceibacterium salegens TaxID=1737568 RepID=A0A6I4SXX2_9SPHN|nr:hypothetical protein [Croceibacterium salegens]MXO59877.1 hypothetical protein [Croceibacterium salegens]